MVHQWTCLKRHYNIALWPNTQPANRIHQFTISAMQATHMLTLLVLRHCAQKCNLRVLQHTQKTSKGILIPLTMVAANFSKALLPQQTATRTMASFATGPPCGCKWRPCPILPCKWKRGILECSSLAFAQCWDRFADGNNVGFKSPDSVAKAAAFFFFLCTDRFFLPMRPECHAPFQRRIQLFQ